MFYSYREVQFLKKMLNLKTKNVLIRTTVIFRAGCIRGRDRVSNEAHVADRTPPGVETCTCSEPDFSNSMYSASGFIETLFTLNNTIFFHRNYIFIGISIFIGTGRFSQSW